MKISYDIIIFVETNTLFVWMRKVGYSIQKTMLPLNHLNGNFNQLPGRFQKFQNWVVQTL